MKETRANEIAEILGKADRWHSHGRGITITELTSEDIKLIIKDFGSDKELSESIKTYYSLMTDYLAKAGISGVIHSQKGLRRAR